MQIISREDVLSALKQVKQPSGEDVVTGGMVAGVVVRGGNVGFAIEIAPGKREEGERLREACERAVRALPGVERVTAVLTSQGGGAAQTPAPAKPAMWNREPLPFVRRVIAIASGKGGVGKSTVTANLAYALSAEGKSVGILDADIYGPSIPMMLGLKGKKPEVESGQIVPLERHGVRAISMGFIAGDDGAVVWRGPMLAKALSQMLRGVRWGTAEAPLHTLLLDMPPGTGDVAISIAQGAPLSGAVIVTTPQMVATLDARKCLLMFEKLNVPILGVVENMSWFEDTSGARLRLFGEGGGERLAKEFHAPFLGALPLLPELREAADKGEVAACALTLFAPLATALDKAPALC